MPIDTGWKYRLLVVDDEEAFLELFRQLANTRKWDTDFEIVTATSAQEALDLATKQVFDTVVTDVQMPGLDGLDLFFKLNDRYPHLPVIILTAYGTVDKAVAAIKAGAYHYFQKPLGDLDLFWKSVSEAAAQKRIADELENLRHDQARRGHDVELVGQSRAWREVMGAITRVAPLPSTVLITGETGTGKEVVARALHRLSPRADRPLVAVSCTEFSGSLLETELFGHERGAFTGAIARRRGIFERAHGGTLFLDEIADTNLEIQAKLLRVLEGSPFFRVGGQEPLLSDFRLITATNRDMAEEIAAGRFRSDLYYRLAVYPVYLPPLRDRIDDVLPLAVHFIEKETRRLKRPKMSLGGTALTMLVQHNWPGNVRELQNMIERAVITTLGPEIQARDLFPSPPLTPEDDTGLRLEKMERLLISLAMDRCGHNKTQAAELLGIARKTLADKIARYGLFPPIPL